jgi:hypothetical protein
VTLLLCALLAACGDDIPCSVITGHCITARFSFAGSEAFDFSGPTSMSSKGGRTELKATDQVNAPYAISIQWDQTQISAPSSFTPNIVGGALELYITRPHPTDPRKVRTSKTEQGTLTFERISYLTGSVISGTFSGIRLTPTKPDDTIDLTVDEGKFSVRVP